MFVHASGVPHEKLHRKFPSWLQEICFLYKLQPIERYEHLRWLSWNEEMSDLAGDHVGSQSQPSKLQGFCKKGSIDIEVFFPYFDMFPCQKGFRHATGIGDYGWLMIIMVICLVHSFLLLSIWCFFHLFVSYSQTILCLSVDGLPRTEDCEFEESLLGATWEFFA